MVGLGTWKSDPGTVGEAILTAIDLGYRHFDCAAIYGNEAEIGAALASAMASGAVSRNELFITSKLWNNAHREQQVQPALEKTLADLRLDYLDLYLMHWPVTVKEGVAIASSAEEFLSLDEVPLSETWQGMECCVDLGLVRNIGVSNFSASKLAGLMDRCRLKPAVNQVEGHPLLRQQALKDFCDANGIAITAYSPLGSGDRPEQMKAADEPALQEIPEVVAIAAAHNITPAQVLIAWAVNRGTAVIPKSVNPERLAMNLACGDITLMAEDMQKLNALDRHFRYVTAKFFELPGGPYSAAGIWDE
jgi:alcohol dehydrogenase (NADP+)